MINFKKLDKNEENELFISYSFTLHFKVDFTVCRFTTIYEEPDIFGPF